MSTRFNRTTTVAREAGSGGSGGRTCNAVLEKTVGACTGGNRTCAQRFERNVRTYDLPAAESGERRQKMLSRRPIANRPRVGPKHPLLQLW